MPRVLQALYRACPGALPAGLLERAKDRSSRLGSLRVEGLAGRGASIRRAAGGSRHASAAVGMHGDESDDAMRRLVPAFYDTY